jgi:hypothetical protein
MDSTSRSSSEFPPNLRFNLNIWNKLRGICVSLWISVKISRGLIRAQGLRTMHCCRPHPPTSDGSQPWRGILKGVITLQQPDRQTSRPFGATAAPTVDPGVGFDSCFFPGSLTLTAHAWRKNIWVFTQRVPLWRCRQERLQRTTPRPSPVSMG